MIDRASSGNGGVCRDYIRASLGLPTRSPEFVPGFEVGAASRATQPASARRTYPETHPFSVVGLLRDATWRRLRSGLPVPLAGLGVNHRADDHGAQQDDGSHNSEDERTVP